MGWQMQRPTDLRSLLALPVLPAEQLIGWLGAFVARPDVAAALEGGLPGVPAECPAQPKDADEAKARPRPSGRSWAEHVRSPLGRADERKVEAAFQALALQR